MNCECKKYIALRNFYLDKNFPVYEGQIIDFEIPNSCIFNGLVAKYNEYEQNAKTAVEKIVARSELDESLSESDTVVATDTVNVVKKTTKKVKKVNPKVVVEQPEKSEIVLEQMLQEETENL